MKITDTFFPDHFSRANKVGIAAGLIVCALSLLSLYYEGSLFTSRDEKKRVIAILKKHTKTVRYKEFGSASFYEINPNEKLQNKDEIFTGEDSTAVVEFSNPKMTLEIPSSTLIRIEVNEEGINTMEVKTDSKVTVTLSENSSMIVKNGSSVEEIKSGASGDSNILIMTNSGLLEYYTSSKGATITSLTSKKEKKINPTTNNSPPPRPLAPRDLTKFILASPADYQKFDIAEGVKISTNIKSNYTVNIFKNFKNTESLFSANFEDSTFNWEDNFKEGSYFLKIEDMKNSKIVSIKFTSKYEVDGYHPADGETLEVHSGVKSTFSWKDLGVKTYKVITTDYLGNEKTHITTSNKLEIDGLSGSSINLVVKPELSNGAYLKSNKSIQVRLKYLGEITFTNIKGNEKYKISDKKINLTWSSPRGGSFEVKVFDRRSNIQIASTHTKQTNTSILLAKEGAFKVLVSSTDFPDLKKAESAYDVSSPVLNWNPGLPREVRTTEVDEEIILKFIKKLKLEKITNLHQKYTPLNGKAVNSVMGIENAGKVKLNGFGEYCYLVHLLAPIDYFHDSDIYCFKLIQLPVFSSVPQAKNAILINNKKDGITSYELTLPSVNNAEKYHAEIYRDSSGKKMIYSIDSNSPQISWKTKRSGIYFMKYKVYDKKNRESPFSTFSKIIFPISPLSSWEDKE
jgi:hypothetical protein